MKIEIWSDFVCPFCYIGKQKMDHVLENFKHKDQIEIEFKSFELDPSARYVPGKSIYETFSESKGMPMEQVHSIFDQVTQAAKEVGLEFRFDIAQTANTFDAHRLYHYAASTGKGNEYVERLKHAHFIEGKVISDYHVLSELAQEIGVNKEDALRILESDAYTDNVRSDINEAHQIGIQGVPFFIFNRKYAISGAQPEEVFVKTLEAAWSEK